MTTKIALQLAVHPTDFEIASRAAKVAGTSVEDFCLIALVRQSRETITENSPAALPPRTILHELLFLEAEHS